MQCPSRKRQPNDSNESDFDNRFRFSSKISKTNVNSAAETVNTFKNRLDKNGAPSVRSELYARQRQVQVQVSIYLKTHRISAQHKGEGLLCKLRSFESLLYLTVAYKVFSLVEQLATALQSKSMTLSGARESVSRVAATLTSLRCESEFMALWKDVSQIAEKRNLPQPEMPRRRQIPKRFDGGGPAQQYTDVISYHRAETWYAFLDTVSGQLEDRFSTDSFRQICNAEDLLIRAAIGKPHTNELQQFINFYDDFDESTLAAQLTILHAAVANRLQTQSAVERLTVMEVANVLKNTDGAQQLLDQVWRLTKLLLVVPATSAIAERSFSALRRVKTYLRATIGQTRLNSVLILNCHQERADNLNIVSIAHDFICASDNRSNAFGNFV